MFLLKTERIYLIDGVDDVFLDVYAIDDKRLAPRDAVLVIPGGGYSYVCLDREGEKTALAYVARGVNAFELNYRASEKDVFPMHLEYAALAMNYIREHAEEYNVNPERIFAEGYSAGGHLCASLATMHGFVEKRLGLPENSARPRGVVLAYPVISAYIPTHGASIANLLNKPFSALTDEERDAYSLEKHVTSETPPAFIWHTATDKDVPVQGSLKYAMACADNGVPFTLHVYPYGPHGICLATDYTSTATPESTQPLAEGWLDASIKWMKTI